MEALNSPVAIHGVAPVAITGVLFVGTEEMGLTETHLVLSQMNSQKEAGDREKDKRTWMKHAKNSAILCYRQKQVNFDVL